MLLGCCRRQPDEATLPQATTTNPISARGKLPAFEGVTRDGETVGFLRDADPEAEEWTANALAEGFRLCSEWFWTDVPAMVGSPDPGGIRLVAVAGRVAEGSGGDGTSGERRVLLMRTRGDAAVFDERTQALPLEDCGTGSFFAAEAYVEIDHAELTISKTVHGEHPLAGKELSFYSLNPGHPPPGATWDVKVRRADAKRLAEAIHAARMVNSDLDSKTRGAVREEATEAVVSFPGEEHALWSLLVYAPEAALERCFGRPDVSLCCVWTDEPGDAWWRIWKGNCVEAYRAGQKLLVYARRNWRARTEPRSLSVSGNDNLSWPGVAIDFKEGDPIEQYGTAQMREVSWLQHMVSEGEDWGGQHVQFVEERVEYRDVETMDEIRAVDADGITYRGEWNVGGWKHGKGVEVNTYGQKFEGVWNEGKKEGEFIATFKDGFSERRMYKDGFQTALLGSTAPGGVEVPAPPSRFR